MIATKFHTHIKQPVITLSLCVLILQISACHSCVNDIQFSWNVTSCKCLPVENCNVLEYLHINVVISLFLGAFAKIEKKGTQIRHIAYISPPVRPSVRPRGTTRLLLDGFSRNLIFELFSKICQ
jgi:hypothetical protein